MGYPIDTCLGKYEDTKGVRRFVGKKDNLKKSGLGPQYIFKYDPFGFLSPLPPHCRAYPEGLGIHLLRAWNDFKDLPRECMRQKVTLDTKATDRELFTALEMGDIWAEAEVAQVWAYLYRNSYLSVPDSWQTTLAEFNATLMDMV